jgi:hypothetical protein
MSKKQQIEVILQIIIIFLSALLFLSILMGNVSIEIITESLVITYIILQYWEKRYLKKMSKKE